MNNFKSLKLTEKAWECKNKSFQCSDWCQFIDFKDIFLHLKINNEI